jgi:hypothetical protein
MLCVPMKEREVFIVEKLLGVLLVASKHEYYQTINFFYFHFVVYC